MKELRQIINQRYFKEESGVKPEKGEKLIEIDNSRLISVQSSAEGMLKVGLKVKLPEAHQSMRVFSVLLINEKAVGIEFSTIDTDDRGLHFTNPVLKTFSFREDGNRTPTLQKYDYQNDLIALKQREELKNQGCINSHYAPEKIDFFKTAGKFMKLVKNKKLKDLSITPIKELIAL